MLKGASNGVSSKVAQSGDLFANLNVEFDPYEKYKNTQDIPLSELLALEKKSLGYYLSGHPVKAIENSIKKIRSKKISDLSQDTKRASLVCLINSVRQIKDKKGKPLTFINFDDGTGVMDGVVAGDTLEDCHNILKEGQILVLKGTVEIDDFRSKDLGDAMYRMRVKEVHSLDSELHKKIQKIVVDIEKSDLPSLDIFSEKLDEIDSNFWSDGVCQLHIRVLTEESEAIIDMGSNYRFEPSLTNISFLKEVFGNEALEI